MDEYSRSEEALVEPAGDTICINCGKSYREHEARWEENDNRHPVYVVGCMDLSGNDFVAA